jgi:hypothetical protein
MSRSFVVERWDNFQAFPEQKVGVFEKSTRRMSLNLVGIQLPEPPGSYDGGRPSACQLHTHNECNRVAYLMDGIGRCVCAGRPSTDLRD